MAIFHAPRGTASGMTGGRSRVLGLLMLGAMALPGPLSAQFSVYPVRLDLSVSSRVATETITLENQGTDALSVVVYLSDYDRTESGGHVYAPFGEHPNTCGDRLEVFPDQLSLEGGARGEVRVRLEPGSSTCWAMLFVEKRTLTASGITVAQRIGVKVVGQGDGLSREGQVLGVAADTLDSPAALVAFENRGTAVVDVAGEVEVRDLAGEVLAVVEMDPFRVLPRRQRHIRVPLDPASLAAGRYLLVAILDFGGEYLAGGQTILDVKP